MRHANRLKRNGLLSPRGRGVTAAHQILIWQARVRIPPAPLRLRRRESRSQKVESRTFPSTLYFLPSTLCAARTHDVAVACRLAMAEVRVRLPLGAFGRTTRPSEYLRNVQTRLGESGYVRHFSASDKGNRPVR